MGEGAYRTGGADVGPRPSRWGERRAPIGGKDDSYRRVLGTYLFLRALSPLAIHARQDVQCKACG